MAGSKSDYLENLFLNHVLGQESFPALGTLYFALFTVAPSDTGGGTEVSTSNWTNYARTAVTNNTTNFPHTTTSTKQNGAAVTFCGGSAATCNSAVTVVAVGIYDSLTGGNLLYWGTLGTNKTINDGDTVTLQTNSVVITED